MRRAGRQVGRSTKQSTLVGHSFSCKGAPSNIPALPEKIQTNSSCHRDLEKYFLPLIIRNATDKLSLDRTQTDTPQNLATQPKSQFGRTICRREQAAVFSATRGAEKFRGSFRHVTLQRLRFVDSSATLPDKHLFRCVTAVGFKTQ